jgi:DNA repair protein RadC
MGMDIANSVRFVHTLAKGSHNSLIITPADIFSHLFRLNLKHFILCHNHPSGQLVPSQEDIDFTDKIRECSKIMGLQFLDHMIINQDEYYSFKKSGLMG